MPFTDIQKTRECRKRWLLTNPDYYQKYRDTHRQRISEYNKKYREKYPDKSSYYNRVYYLKQKEKRELERKYQQTIKYQENKILQDKIKFNKSIINLSTNTPADGLIEPQVIKNNLEDIYCKATHKFIIPTVNIHV